MPNTYFQFKQFRIDQAVAGMKVTTDGCIFGALIDEIQEGRILDIGTGTGLLSLMLAQRSNAQIDAIEINSSVAEQASKNASNSPWNDRIHVQRIDLKDFQPQIQYNQIVCNPPFFNNNSKGASELRNSAIHDDQLSMEVLAQKSFHLLASNGSLWLMYPAYEMSKFEVLALATGFQLSNRIEVFNRKEGGVFRVITQFVKEPTISSTTSQLIIKKPDNSYTKNFIDLLKDYYLHL